MVKEDVDQPSGKGETDWRIWVMKTIFNRKWVGNHP